MYTHLQVRCAASCYRATDVQGPEADHMQKAQHLARLAQQSPFHRQAHLVAWSRPCPCSTAA